MYDIMKDKIKIVNVALKGNDWICGGDKPTIADIQLCLAQLDLQYGILDTNFRNSLNNLNTHFKRVLQLPAVIKCIGTPS